MRVFSKIVNTCILEPHFQLRIGVHQNNLRLFPHKYRMAPGRCKSYLCQKCFFYSSILYTKKEKQYCIQKLLVPKDTVHQ